MTAQLPRPPLSLTFKQILELLQQLGAEERRKLLLFLLGQRLEQDDLTLTHLASERALAQDWLTETEDEAWESL